MTSPAAAQSYALPPTMDSTFASKLRSDFLGLRGTPLEVSGEGVELVSTLCLQVLLSAASTWQTDGQVFELSRPSDQLMGAFNLLGIETDNLVRMT